jgi:hypothetical protein
LNNEGGELLQFKINVLVDLTKVMSLIDMQS